MPLALLLLFAAVGARAECMATMPFLAGEFVLPENPRLILFWPRQYHPKPPKLAVRDAAGRELPFRVERLSISPAYDALALTVTAPDKTRFTVASSTDDWRRVEASYTVDASWKPSSVIPGEVTVSSSSYGWPCSFERVRAASFRASAHAYRVEYRPAEGGPLRSVVVPAQPARFHNDKAPLQAAVLKLGHLNCAGWNFRWGATPVVARAFPLLADGSEGAPVGPLRLEPPPRVGEWYRHDVPPDAPWD